MMERKRTVDLDEGEEQEEKKNKRKKVKAGRKKGIVVSRFFQDRATNERDQGCINGSSKRRRGKKRSHVEVVERVVSPFFQNNHGCISGRRTGRRKKRSLEKAEKVVSRFFQNREQEVGSKLSQRSKGGDHGCLVVDGREIADSDEPIASTAEKKIGKSDTEHERVTSCFFQDQEPEVGMNLSRCSRGGHHNGLVVEYGEIAEIGEPIASMAEKRIEKSDSKEKVISRFFESQEPGVDWRLLQVSEVGCPGGVAALDNGKESTDIDELFSCFAYEKGSDSFESNSREKKISTHFQNREVNSASGPSIWKRIDGTDLKAPVVKAKKEVGTRSRNPLALERNKEAYRRKDANNTWKPPRSEHRLLQEDHAHDPWRVLVICMLLNLTTGRQTGKILERLFGDFPDAKAAADAPEERIEEIIKTLGLQKKRAHMIKRMSQEYLGENWTHVTQLHGVGKYAADAYAIFCTGKWYEVTPVDHKLKDYWDYLWANEDIFK